ncbi:hypothetical protein SLEP1_g55352 [Rubroshorea leprosula]|uniref:Uncharacterized protein n=1 Tax=Rubroshorea leprosula TaxID=152421 RepID=A0AAV5MIB3_9ROSI|nr:hypothetical protein SLEP1_g55352 [Rubroshorea leprosula]
MSHEVTDCLCWDDLFPLLPLFGLVKERKMSGGGVNKIRWRCEQNQGRSVMLCCFCLGCFCLGRFCLGCFCLGRFCLGR